MKKYSLEWLNAAYEAKNLEPDTTIVEEDLEKLKKIIKLKDERFEIASKIVKIITPRIKDEHALREKRKSAEKPKEGKK